MKKADKVKLIAERVMGYWMDNGWWAGDQCPIADFDPYDNDADCMAVWDKFSEEHLTFLSGNTGDNDWLAGWTDPNERDHETENKDRRTAMCDCVVEAVK